MASLVGRDGDAVGCAVVPGHPATCAMVVLHLDHLGGSVLQKLTFALVRPLQAREATADVLAQFLHGSRSLVLVRGAGSVDPPLAVATSKRLQFLDTDLRRGVWAAWVRAGRAERLVRQLVGRKSVTQLANFVVCLLDGLQLEVHPSHLLIGAAFLVRDSTALRRRRHMHLGLPSHLCERSNDVLEQDYLPLVALIGILVVHDLYHLSHLLVALQLLAFEAKVEAQFPQADGAEGEGLLVRLVQLRGAVHEALIRLAMSHGEDMAQLVASCLDGPVLHQLCHLGVEHARRLVRVLGKVGMVPCVALDADSPALLGHTEDEGPTVFRVEVCVGQHEQALVLLEMHVVLQVLEDLPGVELLHSSVATHSCLDHALPL